MVIIPFYLFTGFPFLSISLRRHCVECKAWVDDCATKCLDEEEEQCTEECKNMLEEHKARCFLECSTVTWEYGEVVEGEVPKHWVNCTHRNASYCQYRLPITAKWPVNIPFCSFSYELETWGKDGPEKVNQTCLFWRNFLNQATRCYCTCRRTTRRPCAPCTTSRTTSGWSSGSPAGSSGSACSPSSCGRRSPRSQTDESLQGGYHVQHRIAVSLLSLILLQVRGGAADDEVELERQPDLPASHHHHPEPHVLQRFLSEIWQNAQQVFQKETPIQSLKKWQSLILCQFSAMLVVVEVQDYLTGSKWLRIECVKSGKGELTWKIGDVLPERCSKHDVITQTPPETDSDGGRGVCSQNCLFDGFRSCSMLTKCWQNYARISIWSYMFYGV